MEIYCTRPGCPRPQNYFADLDDVTTLQTAQQKYCTSCGMQLILVGRYIPSKLLGRGGFGAAFLALDRYTPTRRQCVVKQFQPAGNLNPQQLQQAQTLFEREAAVLEQIGNRHTQIPDLFAFFPLIVPSMQPGQEDQFFYIVQEFIDGHNLEEELQTQGQFSEAQALEVLQEILKVLKFVHSTGSIHRDIKPSNIMRHRDGRLFLLDFGAVSTAAAGGGSPGQSTGIYSMGFAPPEQMSGAQVYPSTDLYALAVTVITLLTGKDPAELYDSYTNQWNWHPHVQVNDTLADVLDRMLRSTPNQRFGSAQEALDALTPQPPSPPVTPPLQPLPVRPSNPLPSVPVTSPPPTPVPPVTQPPVPPTPVTPFPAQPLASHSRFSVVNLLGSAAFTGFEAGLLFIALRSLFGFSGISMGLLGMIVAGLIFAQYRRVLEGKDLLIIAGLTVALMFIPALRVGLALPYVLVVAGFVAAGAIAVTAIFRLVYLLLSRLL